MTYDDIEEIENRIKEQEAKEAKKEKRQRNNVPPRQNPLKRKRNKL